MSAEIFGAVRQAATCEELLHLQRLYLESGIRPPEPLLAQLVDSRLAYFGPPPMLEAAISYRGRQALRLAKVAHEDRDRFAASLKASRTRAVSNAAERRQMLNN